ncbi:hypothetical protein HK098_001266 [Nowakowskiella sp. JEL0407]|nr:hypothetical protein HK098_001266 [Nowakowskiella sp. JEL0407]
MSTKIEVSGNIGIGNHDGLAETLSSHACANYTCSESLILPVGPGLRIGICDDDPIIQQTLKFALSKNKNIPAKSVFTFNDGVDCLEALSRTIVDILLLDIDMPNLNGDITALCIRNHDMLSSNIPKNKTINLHQLTNNVLVQNRNIPIIAITSNNRAQDIELYLNSGINLVLQKPVRFKELYSAIENTLI